MAMKGPKKPKSGGEPKVVPGDILLGKYRVERKLGQGGMGIVVAARHLELGELFAIKYLAKSAQNEPIAVLRFLREARSSARLKGEHVAKVHDVGRLDSGMPYMIMEYLDGQDLKAYLAKRGKLPVEEAVSLVLQASDAIAEAHALGIIHRDLKPSNLFLTKRRDGTPCLKVLDFGIAKEISAQGAELTKSGATLGSPLYMSPEQMAGSKTLDTRTDIWSLGVVLYELVTGAVPFYAETITELVAQVLQTIPKPPSYICPELPPWIDEVLIHCLEKLPEDRFLTIDDFARALRTAGKANTEVAKVIVAMPKEHAIDAVDALDTTARSDDLPFAKTDASTSTKDVSTLDSSAREGIRVQASRDKGDTSDKSDKEIATNTLTNPTWDTNTTSRAVQKPQQNRSKLVVIVGAAVAIVVLMLGAMSLFRAQSGEKKPAATSSATPPTVMESTEPMPPAPIATLAPSTVFETVPEVPVSAAPQSAITASPRNYTQKPPPVASAAIQVGKKETETGPQPSAAPAPSRYVAPKSGYEGVL